MNSAARSPETVFNEAIEIQSPEERRSYLDRACEGDMGLRQAVEKLITLHSQAGDFLESPAVKMDVTAFAPPLDERPGTVIGPYKLLQQIGEGGMGVVFMAEQTQPIQRTVALKIIKPGLDTRQVIARFEAERQAVAMMDHPNIAKVLDAGTTEAKKVSGTNGTYFSRKFFRAFVFGLRFWGPVRVCTVSDAASSREVHSDRGDRPRCERQSL
jgi:serine/threonine protein kinase